MPVGGDFWGGRPIEVKNIIAVTLSARVNAVVGVAVTHIVRPAGMNFIAFQVLVDDFWIKPGYHPGRTFLDGDVTVGADTIADTAHGFTAGDGPYQITLGQAALAGAPGVIIDAPTDTFTRDAGSWLDEGFVVGQTITVTGSASNNSDFVILTLTDLVLTTTEDITVSETSQTDLVITAAGEALPTGLAVLTDYFVGVVDDDTFTLHTVHNDAVKDKSRVDITAIGAGGVFTIAEMTSANPSATNEDGQEAPVVTTVSGAGGELASVSAMPTQLTVRGSDAGSELVYWFLP